MSIGKQIANKFITQIPSNDHRAIGLRQKLFFFHELSQGSCFFQPRGAHIYNKLIDYLRSQYKSRNYHEVITPNIYNCEMWKTSGHWEHYEKNMIKFLVSEREFSLKPMNCPGHCLMFKHQDTLRADQLPVRWADFGVLHRNELSGSLSGLSRVRRFQQDDAHIFCRSDQVESEVAGCLEFASQVYEKFEFKFDLRLSLRPEAHLGNSEQWDQAEEALRRALEFSGYRWSEEKFEGAFYGPKIDLIVRDQANRSQQCATIQLDFQLPERFELVYKPASGEESKQLLRPVIIHRAILGSVERFLAMIAENYNGRWPFWLSPVQLQVVPIHTNFNSYAKRVCDQLKSRNFWADCDLRSTVNLNGKVREALLLPYNLILIVGAKEEKTDSVTVRLVVGEADNCDTLERKENDIAACVSNRKEFPARNINIPLANLIELLTEFERNHVNRADLKLLEELGE